MPTPFLSGKPLFRADVTENEDLEAAETDPHSVMKLVLYARVVIGIMYLVSTTRILRQRTPRSQPRDRERLLATRHLITPTLYLLKLPTLILSVHHRQIHSPWAATLYSQSLHPDACWN
jgi:hypothetical protein